MTLEPFRGRNVSAFAGVRPNKKMELPGRGGRQRCRAFGHWGAPRPAAHFLTVRERGYWGFLWRK